MTNISKEAVERYSIDIFAHTDDGDYWGLGPDENGEWVKYSDYTALQARVEELEATHVDNADAWNMVCKARANGRLQGLDEALTKAKAVKESADNYRARAGHMDDLWESRGQQCAAGNIVTEIEILRSKSNEPANH